MAGWSADTASAPESQVKPLKRLVLLFISPRLRRSTERISATQSAIVEDEYWEGISQGVERLGLENHDRASSSAHVHEVIAPVIALPHLVRQAVNNVGFAAAGNPFLVLANRVFKGDPDVEDARRREDFRGKLFERIPVAVRLFGRQGRSLRHAARELDDHGHAVKRFHSPETGFLDEPLGRVHAGLVDLVENGVDQRFLFDIGQYGQSGLNACIKASSVDPFEEIFHDLITSDLLWPRLSDVIEVFVDEMNERIPLSLIGKHPANALVENGRQTHLHENEIDQPHELDIPVVVELGQLAETKGTVGFRFALLKLEQELTQLGLARSWKSQKK